jgi:tetratricopeptide (TPR) repeat protein
MADSPRIEELRRRVQSDPASIAFAALAEEYRRAGRFEEAIATCHTGLQRHPSYLSAHVTLGRALIEVGQFEEAQEELEYVLKLAPENLAAIRGLAEIHHRRGDDSHESYTAATDAARGETAADAAAAHAAAHVAPAPEPPAPPLDLPLNPPAEAQAPFEPVAPEVETAPAPVEPPALAGLEALLAAIQRARSGRSAAR